MDDDQERYVLRGWQAYRRLLVPANTSPIVRDRIKQAYFAGAAVLFETLMHRIEGGPNDEPSDADMKCMRDLHDEISEFGQDLDRKVLAPLFERKQTRH